MPLELPNAFTDRISAQLGDEYPDFRAALDGKPVVSLRYNPRKPGAHFDGATPIPWNPHGIYLDERPQFFKDPLIYAGGYYVQEASSMLIGQLADFSQDMTVLDLCAAPGGKSTLLASLLSPDSLLVSNEIVRNRANVLVENISRWGHPNVVVTNSHPRDFTPLHNYFDLIVVDAPCSGEGMFRKDPKVIGHWSSKMVQHCADRQKDILRAVMHCLKPGGRLVYTTCTYNPIENEGVVQWLLGQDRGLFELVDLALPAEWGLVPGTVTGFAPEMCRTGHCYPHRVRGEGFFLSCLEKTRASSPPMSSPRSQKRRKNKRKVERAPRGLAPAGRKDRDIAAPYVSAPADWQWVDRDGILSLLPAQQAPAMEALIRTLDVMKAGIEVGEVKKGKLIVAHDLAMSEQVAAEVPVIEVDYDAAMRYLKKVDMQIELP